MTNDFVQLSWFSCHSFFLLLLFDSIVHFCMGTSTALVVCKSAPLAIPCKTRLKSRHRHTQHTPECDAWQSCAAVMNCVQTPCSVKMPFNKMWKKSREKSNEV